MISINIMNSGLLAMPLKSGIAMTGSAMMKTLQKVTAGHSGAHLSVHINKRPKEPSFFKQLMTIKACIDSVKPPI